MSVSGAWIFVEVLIKQFALVGLSASYLPATLLPLSVLFSISSVVYFTVTEGIQGDYSFVSRQSSLRDFLERPLEYLVASPFKMLVTYFIQHDLFVGYSITISAASFGF